VSTRDEGKEMLRPDAYLGKTARAVLAHMRDNPEVEFLPLCTRDEHAAKVLVTHGLAAVRTELRTTKFAGGKLEHSVNLYRLT
jgi:hypothetical protein